MAAVQTQLKSVDKSIKDLERCVGELNVAMKEIKLSPSQTAKNVAELGAQERAVKKLTKAYVEAEVAESALGRRTFSGPVMTSFSPGRDTRGTGYMTRGPMGTNFPGQTLRPGQLGYNESGYLSGAAQAEATRLRSRTGLSTQAAFAGGVPSTVISDAERAIKIYEEARRKTRIAYQEQRLYENEKRNLERARIHETDTLSHLRGVGGGIVLGGRDPRMLGKVFGAVEGATTGGSAEFLRKIGYSESEVHALASGSGDVGRAGRKFEGFSGILSGGGSRRGGMHGGDGGGGNYLTRLYHGRYGDSGRGHYDVPGLNALAGVLPGGRRARPLAVLSGLTTGLAATPAAIPGAAGLAVGLSGAIGGLIGGVATLKLAFAGLDKAAFTTQKGFNALNPAQKEFVMSLRSLQAGFVKPLEQLASSKVLPGLTKALHQAMTPGAVNAIRGGVSAFGGAISGGAQQFGKLFGSTGFSSQFGIMLKQDAGYLRDMLSGATNLTDAFVHLSVAAGPFVNWMSKGVLHFTKWIDLSIQASQESGRLASYFDKARKSLQTFGKLLGSVSSVFGAFFGAVGFDNSTKIIDTFSMAFGILADIINNNKDILRQFFTGAIQAAGDILLAVRELTKAFRPLLTLISRTNREIQHLTGGVNTFRIAIDLVASMIALKFLKGLGGVGVESRIAAGGLTVMATGATGLRNAVLGALGPLGTLFLALLKLNDEMDKTKSLQSKGAVPVLGDNYKGHKVGDKPFIGPGGVKGTLIKGDSGTSYFIPSPAKNGGLLGGIGKQVTGAVSSVGSQVQSASDAGAFVPAPPFDPTAKSSVLPTKLQTAIDKAVYKGSVKDQVAAINVAIKWIDSHVDAVKNASNKDLYYQEGIGLKSQRDSIQSKAIGGKPSLLTQVFPASRQAALAKAQSRFASASATGNTATQLQGVNQMLRVAGDQLKFLSAEQNTVAHGSKKWLEIVREIKVINGTITAAMKEQVKTLKQIAAEHKKVMDAAADKAMQRAIGLPTGTGQVSALRARAMERSALLGIAKTLAPKARGGRGVASSDPLRAIPGFANLSVPQMIKALDHHGVDFTKAARKDFERIKNVIAISEKTGRKIPADVFEKMREYLRQISEHTKAQLHAIPTSYRLASVKELMRGLKGSPQVRKALAQRLVEVESMGGKIHHGQSAFGYPASHTTIHKVEIIIQGYEKDPKVIAAEVHKHLSKAARQNPTQVHGPNAGRNRNLN